MEIKKERREWGFSLVPSLIGWGEWIQHLFNLSVIRKKHWNDIELCFEVFETKNQSVHDEIIIDTQTSSMKDKSPKHFHFIIWYVFVNDWIFQTLFFRQTINSYLLHLSYSHSLSNHLYFIHMLSYSLLSSILLSIVFQTTIFIHWIERFSNTTL